MKIFMVIITVLLVASIIMLAYVVFKIRHLSQPVIRIDEQAAKIIAEQLASMPSPTNKYDAIMEITKSKEGMLPSVYETVIKETLHS